MNELTGAEGFKIKGNEAFKTGNFAMAIDHYSEGIALEPTSHILFSNRCACHLKLEDWTAAEADALQCIHLCAEFAKGHFRLSTALLGRGLREDAVNAMQAALDLSAEDADISTKLDALRSELTIEALDKLPAKDFDSLLKFWSRSLLNRYTQSKLGNARVQILGEPFFHFFYKGENGEDSYDQYEGENGEDSYDQYEGENGEDSYDQYEDEEAILKCVKDAVVDQNLYVNFTKVVPMLSTVYNSYTFDKPVNVEQIPGIFIMLSNRVAISPFLPHLIFLRKEFQPFDIIFPDAFSDEVVAKMSFKIQSKLLSISFQPCVSGLQPRKVLIPRIGCATLSSKLPDDVLNHEILPLFSVSICSNKEKPLRLNLNTGYNSYRESYYVEFISRGLTNQLNVTGHFYSDSSMAYDDYIQYVEKYSTEWILGDPAEQTEWVSVPGTTFSGTPRGYY